MDLNFEAAISFKCESDGNKYRHFLVESCYKKENVMKQSPERAKYRIEKMNSN